MIFLCRTLHIFPPFEANDASTFYRVKNYFVFEVNIKNDRYVWILILSWSTAGAVVCLSIGNFADSAKKVLQVLPAKIKCTSVVANFQKSLKSG